MSKALQYGPTPTLASLLELHRKSTMRQINCHQVGEIVSFDASKQTAEVQIKMTFLLNKEIKTYPLLIDCPCVVLAGGEGRVTFPIKKGDSCLVLFNDRDMDNWFSGGQTMPPRTNRYHDFSDAIALVGLRNMQNKISDYLADGTELKYSGSTIKLQDNKVTITNGTATIEMNSGNVTITCANMTVMSPTVSFSGDVAIAGAVAITGAASIGSSLTVQGKDIGPQHTHSGVRSGNDNTGGVV